jgi:FAD/FMN-containing dehydrogenase
MTDVTTIAGFAGDVVLPGDPAYDQHREVWNAMVLADPGDAGVRRAYRPEKYARLAALKASWDPDNLFHLNQNIPPSVA